MPAATALDAGMRNSTPRLPLPSPFLTPDLPTRLKPAHLYVATFPTSELKCQARLGQNRQHAHELQACLTGYGAEAI